MSKRQYIWGLAETVAVAEPDTEPIKMDSTEPARVTQQANLFEDEPLKPELTPAPPPTFKPALLDAFKASVDTFRILGEQHISLTERIRKGVDYCRNHPRDKAAYSLLAAIRAEQAELQKRLDAEAQIQHDLEREIITAAGLTPGEYYVCSGCFTVGARACRCRVDVSESEDVVRCSRCNALIVDSVVEHPSEGNDSLVDLSVEAIVRVTQQNAGRVLCLACYRAGEGK